MANSELTFSNLAASRGRISIIFRPEIGSTFVTVISL